MSGQPIFSSLRETVNPGVPFSITSSETPPAPGPTGAHRCNDEVRLERRR